MSKPVILDAPVMNKLGHMVVDKVGNVVDQIKGALNLFAMSDDKIIELIYETHVHTDESFDEDSLFVVVESTLNRATEIVDKLVQGGRIHLDIQDRSPKPNFTVPLCTLKSINNELCCKAPGEETAHKTALTILHKLSGYSWEAKAVLTLAAFALEFSDFWMIAHNYTSNQLARHLAVLKKVPDLITPSVLQKHRVAILELSTLIKTTMRVIAMFDEFEKLSALDPKDVPGLPEAVNHMPVDVYWTILIVAACATKFSILISDEPDKPHDLAPYAQKISFILNKLTAHLTIFRRHVAEAENFRRIRKLLRTPTEIMEVIRALIYNKEIQPLIDGSTNRMVNINVLRRKTVYLFLSTLDITDKDISKLKPVYDAVKREKNYAIVWIPVVEQWTDELWKKFDALRVKMPWYVVQQFSPIAGLRFIKDEWKFSGKPTLVVLNPKGQVENPNAFHLITTWGLKAFPFDREAEKKIADDQKWITAITPADEKIVTWVKEDKYILYYGGKDNNWIQQFYKKATAFINDPVLKELNIHIELYCVGKTPKGGEDHNILEKFWTGVESLFLSKTPKKKEEPADPVAQEIQKLLSYKNETGWALLTKGSRVITVAHGTSIFKVFEDKDSWKESVKEGGFESVITTTIVSVNKITRQCTHLSIPNVAGKVPEAMNCPVCPLPMETYISYKCCHADH